MTYFPEIFSHPTVQAGVIGAISGAIAAPIVTQIAKIVSSVAFAVSPMQGLVFCASLEILSRFSSSFAYGIISALDIGCSGLDEKIKMAVHQAFYALTIGAILFCMLKLTPCLALSFGTALTTHVASTIVAGSGVFLIKKMFSSQKCPVV
ncbi:MAG: hypothetical protein ACXU9U_01690 [Parachlamydiaceae bacterium]